MSEPVALDQEHALEVEKQTLEHENKASGKPSLTEGDWKSSANGVEGVDIVIEIMNKRARELEQDNIKRRLEYEEMLYKLKEKMNEHDYLQREVERLTKLNTQLKLQMRLLLKPENSN